MNTPEMGDTSICQWCNKEIIWLGYWDHFGELTPRHPAVPISDAEAEAEAERAEADEMAVLGVVPI